MKCQLFECENETKGNYPCCSQEHGITLRLHKDGIRDSFNADEDRKYGFRELYSVPMAEHYAKQNDTDRNNS